MASTAVSVLAPNGRRQTVKCSPNTTIMQIIEEVCQKQGFPPSDYDIKHHNKVLDTNTLLRFSGLPNNAQLELAPVTKVRQESEVTLAVNFENGQRLMGNFLPDDNLWTVLHKLCPKQVENNPVVIYTRQEIYGDALKSTTLRSLGLTSGRAMVRLVHKSPEELKTQANVSAPLPSKPVEEKPYHRTLKPVEDEPREAEVRQVQKRQEVDYLKIAREKRKLAESPAVSNDSSPKSKQKIEEEAMDVDGVQQKKEVKEKNRKIIKSSKPEMKDDDFVFLGERNAMIFSLETAHTVPTDDLPDDFFELTIDDAKIILKDIRRKRSEMEDNPLLTSNLRELEESKKQLRQLNKYKKSIIRIQFPDRMILQGIFAPTETIGDVLNFVKDYLEDRQLNFYLYTTPPKNVLSHDSKLIEVDCVPGALLHLGLNSSVDSSRNFLKDGLKRTSNSVASLAASKMRKEATRNVPDYTSAEESEDLNLPGPSTRQYNNYPKERKVKSPDKVPKWFKTAK